MKESGTFRNLEVCPKYWLVHSSIYLVDAYGTETSLTSSQEPVCNSSFIHFSQPS